MARHSTVAADFGVAQLLIANALSDTELAHNPKSRRAPHHAPVNATESDQERAMMGLAKF